MLTIIDGMEHSIFTLVLYNFEVLPLRYIKRQTMFFSHKLLRASFISIDTTVGI